MPKQMEIVLAPRGGLRYDIPATLISPMEMSDCRNVFFGEGLVKKRFGYTTVGENLPLAGPVIGMDQFYTYGGNNYMVCMTTKLAYRLNSPTSSPYWETINTNEVEDNCETTWTSDMGANGAVADETTIKKVGSTSQKISPAAGFTTGLAAHRDQALGDKSAYTFVRLWIRSSINQATGDLQFCIDDTGGCGSPTETLDIPALVADTWKLVFLEASDPASNMNAIASLGLKIATDNGACDIYIDDIRFVKAFSSSVAYGTTDEDLVSITSIRDINEIDLWWIVTNGVDAIQKVTTAGLTDLVVDYPAGVTALLAKYVIEFKDHLLLLDVTEDGDRYPQRIRWSNTAQPADFLNGNASYQDLSGMDRVKARNDWIKGARKFKGDYLVIAKANSIWLGHATGETDIFQFDLRVPNVGCVAGETLRVQGDNVYFLGYDDVYSFDGIDVRSIGEPIRNELFESINPGAIGKSFAILLEDQYEYWLFVPVVGEDYCKTAWCYDYGIKTWTRHRTAHFLTTYSDWLRQSQLTIGDLVGTIGEQTWRIGSRTSLANMPITVFGDVDGYVYEYSNLRSNDNGTAIDGWFTTKDFNPTRLESRFRVNRIDVYYTGAGLDVAYSTDKGRTWIEIESLGNNDDIEVPAQIWLKLDCNLFRLRFRNAEAGEHFDFSRANIFWSPSGYRIK